MRQLLHESSLLIFIYRAGRLEREGILSRREESAGKIRVLCQRAGRNGHAVVSEYPTFAVALKSLGFKACAELVSVDADARDEVSSHLEYRAHALRQAQSARSLCGILPSTAEIEERVADLLYRKLYFVFCILVERHVAVCLKKRNSRLAIILDAHGSQKLADCRVGECGRDAKGIVFIKNIHNFLLS